jgi:hypothetical protein
MLLIYFDTPEQLWLAMKTVMKMKGDGEGYM